jgi:hypothetical protein
VAAAAQARRQAREPLALGRPLRDHLPDRRRTPGRGLKSPARSGAQNKGAGTPETWFHWTGQCEARGRHSAEWTPNRQSGFGPRITGDALVVAPQCPTTMSTQAGLLQGDAWARPDRRVRLRNGNRARAADSDGLRPMTAERLPHGGLAPISPRLIRRIRRLLFVVQKLSGAVPIPIGSPSGFPSAAQSLYARSRISRSCS